MMSIKLMSQIWDNKDPELKGSKLVVLLCLADHANDDGICWPSIARISERARINKRMTIYHIQKLEAAGYLEIKHEEGKHNTYIVHATRATHCTSTRAIHCTSTRAIHCTPPVQPIAPESLVNRQEEPPLEPKRETRSSPSGNLKPYDVAVILAEVCGMNLKANKGRLLRNAKALLEADPDLVPETITANYGPGGWWWIRDWRGKKGEYPRPEDVKETWGRWAKQVKKSAQPAPVDPQMEALRKARENGSQYR